MLQRAASNAYSWWWASHIRTKQSKWLDNDLQEMEERVKSMIRLIEEDADSFAKKAEMYYRRRPELINFVEESYKAYKALADRYDRISGELHKANHTIATAFPDQVQMMEDEVDDSSPKAISSIKSTKLLNPPPDFTKFPKPPAELPRISSRNKAREDRFAPKKPHHIRVTSQISRDKAQDEIDRLQKGILVFQTEKEFFKRSYESGLAKYWDIERKMTEMQEEVSQLQDEFSASSVIEDDEARALMAATALKSCEDTLFSLQEQQKRSMEEARLESQRIKVAKEKLKALKGEKDTEEISDKDIAVSSTCMEEVGSLKHERLELKSICEKVKEHFEMSSDSSVVELAEKIEELVDKVISLELTVSSQTAQIKRLSSDTDALQKHLRGLEEDKMNLPDNSNSSSERLKQVEEELQIIQDLERSVQHEKGILRSHFTEACDSLNDLSEKLQSPKQKGQVSFKGEAEISVPNIETLEESKDVKDKKIQKTKENLIEEVYSEEISNSEKIQEEQNDDGMDQGGELKSQVEENEDSPDWQQLLLNGLEGKEKILLYEYTSILRNYKETKNRLTEIEKKNQECHSETMQQIQELRSDNAIKDEEIKTLRQKVFSSTSLHSSSIKRPKSQEPSNPKNTQKLEDLIVAKHDKAFEVSDTRSPLAEEEVKLCQIDQQHTSAAEEKFRADIDTLLEENLDFWLRFSTSYHQIRKFQSTFKELQAEIEKLSEIRNQDGSRGNIGSASVEQAAMPDSSPTDKKLRELNTKLQVWLEQNGLLKGELQCRFASLCSIQEDILKVSKASEGEEVQFTPYQAAKFQGEVINMQQENNKVAKELQDGLDHVRGLQVEVGRALSKLHESFELSGSRGRNHYHPLRLLSTKTRIPLRTFLFGVKPKKPSIFSCMNPALHKQYSDLRAGGFPT